MLWDGTITLLIVVRASTISTSTITDAVTITNTNTLPVTIAMNITATSSMITASSNTGKLTIAALVELNFVGWYHYTYHCCSYKAMVDTVTVTDTNTQPVTVTIPFCYHFGYYGY